MTKLPPHPDEADTLRTVAEEQAQARETGPHETPSLPPEETWRILHELRVHQIELEMQNEELRRTQAELEAARARYFDLYDLAPVGYATVSEEGLVLDANLTAASLLGVARGAMTKRPFSQHIFREDQDIYYRHRKTLAETREPQACELRMVRRDGTPFWVHLKATSAMSADGASPAFRLAIVDITTRKQLDGVQTFLAQTSSGTPGEPFFNTLARYLAESLGMDFVCIDRLDGDGLTARTVAVWCDGQFEDNVTYALKDTPCGDVVGKTVCCFPASVCAFFPRDRVLQDLRAESYVGVTLFGHTGRPIGLIAVISRRPLANRLLAEAMLTLVGVRAAGELERLEAEASLRESEAKHRMLFDSAGDGILIHDCDARMLAVNQMACDKLGYTHAELMSMTTGQVDSPEEAPNVPDRIARITEQGPLRFETVHRRKDGSDIPIEVNARRITWDGVPAIMSICRDITERKEAEEKKGTLEGQLQQAQKMEFVGRLAGGVAHDFNNMLSVILGHADLALDRVDPSQPLYADLEEIRKAASRSSDLTRQLLAFARKQTIAPRMLDLNETIAGMLKMLERLIGEDIHLRWQPAADLWPVRVDPSQIDQILANLCVNARDAIAGVGTLTVETENTTFDEEACVAHPGLLPGDYVRIAVSDDGCGMEAGTLAHIFEPFFTTKVLGKGTGLGLATIYGIVKQNSGFINVYSEPDHGTTFTIYLPRHVGKADQELKGASAKPGKRGDETILLVEDEPAILKLATMMLERQGYTVLAAGTPGEAMHLAREFDGEIHLLVSDVVMPEMNGRELAKNLLVLYPHVERLFMSGYTADVIARHGVLEEGVHFIEKPFSVKDLAAKVREALGQGIHRESTLVTKTDSPRENT